MSSVLLFSLDPKARATMREFLERCSYEVQPAESLGHARELVERFAYDILLADVDDSRELLRKVQQLRQEETPESMLLFLVKRGAFSSDRIISDEHEIDVVEKPFSNERLRIHLERALESRKLRYEAQWLRHERGLIHHIDGFVAVSPVTRGVLELARKVAQSDATALLTGETGTGKEVIAGAIHYGSARAAGPFVKVNCAALPTQLLESELFGHEKGAFTGADRLRIGRFEHANTGTIFFDEVGDMSLETQAKVLRVVQEREFQRVGSSRTIHTDVRIIAATNKDLPKAVDAGEFREDLYYRLNVISIQIPALRERQEDILPLVEFFVAKLSGDLKKPQKSFTPEAIEAILAHPWPGNIRELKNVVERAVLLSDGLKMTVDDLGLPESEAPRPTPGSVLRLPRGGANLKDVERSFVVQALERTDWVQKDAAVLLGVSTRVLNHKIRRFGIKHPRWRKNV